MSAISEQSALMSVDFRVSSGQKPRESRAASPPRSRRLAGRRDLVALALPVYKSTGNVPTLFPFRSTPAHRLTRPTSAVVPVLHSYLPLRFSPVAAPCPDILPDILPFPRPPGHGSKRERVSVDPKPNTCSHPRLQNRGAPCQAPEHAAFPTDKRCRQPRRTPLTRALTCAWAGSKKERCAMLQRGRLSRALIPCKHTFLSYTFLSLPVPVPPPVSPRGHPH